ncbi:MAG: N-6 DNA methylase [Candidatus Peribacteraceae bacterium]|nr:N-6 DNA methylase [Candidatus Peribacteraceae bacterium]
MPEANTQKPLFHSESAVAMRQPKTDRLILKRLLQEAARDMRLDEEELQRSHAIMLKWSDLERAGSLEHLNETQMQGDFLAQVFGDALGYTSELDGKETWYRIQHEAVGGETPDAVLGRFSAATVHTPSVVVELKGPKIHVDRHRSNGRTAVDQCWDYIVNTPPSCRWGIVSNIVSFRLYERNSTKRAYEHFSLEALRDFEIFKQFYVLFHREGLLESAVFGPGRAAALLGESTNRQREIGDALYDEYSGYRTDLIQHLHFKIGHSVDESIEMTQRLFDRIMFVAFCEDRGLLPKETLAKAYLAEGFHAVTNPRWQNFKHLFQFIDQGNDAHNIPHYNGGLFAPHAVDELELEDEPWTTFFKSISGYDFSDEVNLDVLGHLFEKSITEIEKLKESGLFGGDAEKTEEFATMPQSAKRKQLGVYYTPPELTGKIVEYTLEELITERFREAAEHYGIAKKDAAHGMAPDDPAYWQECLHILQDLKIVDPACGSGAFLFQAYNVLEQRYNEVIGYLEQSGEKGTKELFDQVPQFILQKNLYGVDLSPEAVEITQLALWIRSATPGHTLAKLADNIVHGNSLVHDPKVDTNGFKWEERFPDVFEGEAGGFDCVVGNPPWERIKLQEREFFAVSAPEIATATNAAKRRKLVEALKAENPELYRKYQEALAGAEAHLKYCHKSGEYPLTGKGDTNLYAVFAELAFQLVSPRGRVGFLVPSGIASDKTTKDFFAAIAESNRLIRLYDFENKKNFFPDIDGRIRFCILNFGGAESATDAADFVFFIHRIEELQDRKRHIALSGEDIKLLNPNTRTCPIFRSQRDAEITKDIYRRVPVLIDENRKGDTGNLWGVKFHTMFHQTNDAELFQEAKTLKEKGCKLEGNRWVKGKQVYLPLYEAKMFRPYDHRFGTVFEDTSNWVNQGQTTQTTIVQHSNPEFVVLPRWWVDASVVGERSGPIVNPATIGFRDVTRATDTRTFLATFLPKVGSTNKVPLIATNQVSIRELCLLANLNAFPLDFCARQKFGGISLNFFIVEQLPILPPEFYEKPCSWSSKHTLEDWISERVLKLTCTAEDMLPLAEACNFTSGSFQKEYGGKLHKWDEQDRAEIRAELDAAYFHLYGINREDAEYILSTFNGIHENESLFPEHCSMAERILKKYEEMA